MRRLIMLALVALPMAAAPAATAADPRIFVMYQDEQLRVTLDGSYAGAYYWTWRSDELVGPYALQGADATLCTGDCFLTDSQVTPGRTYYYRFDLQAPDGRSVVYGPYAVTIPDTPIAARVSPNPSRSTVRVELSLPGSRRGDIPLGVDARVIDLQGRAVRVLFSGPLGRGVTTVTWDGRDDSGHVLDPGIYFVRLTTPVGASTTRVVRSR